MHQELEQRGGIYPSWSGKPSQGRSFDPVRRETGSNVGRGRGLHFGGRSLRSSPSV